MGVIWRPGPLQHVASWRSLAAEAVTEPTSHHLTADAPLRPGFLWGLCWTRRVQGA